MASITVQLSRPAVFIGILTAYVLSMLGLIYAIGMVSNQIPSPSEWWTVRQETNRRVEILTQRGFTDITPDDEDLTRFGTIPSKFVVQTGNCPFLVFEKNGAWTIKIPDADLYNDPSYPEEYVRASTLKQHADELGLQNCFQPLT